MTPGDERRRRRWSKGSVAGLALVLGSCGGRGPEPEPPVKRETAQDEIARIGSGWLSTEEQKSLLSPPSPLNVLTVTRTSQLEFSPEGVREKLEITEVMELRSGSTVRCLTQFEHGLVSRFGRTGGEAAVELFRPALSASRRCDGTPPEPILAEPARRGLLVLRADQLHVIQPATDDRVYRPISR